MNKVLQVIVKKEKSEGTEQLSTSFSWRNSKSDSRVAIIPTLLSEKNYLRKYIFQNLRFKFGSRIVEQSTESIFAMSPIPIIIMLLSLQKTVKKAR